MLVYTLRVAQKFILDIHIFEKLNQALVITEDAQLICIDIPKRESVQQTTLFDKEDEKFNTNANNNNSEDSDGKEADDDDVAALLGGENGMQQLKYQSSLDIKKKKRNKLFKAFITTTAFC